MTGETKPREPWGGLNLYQIFNANRRLFALILRRYSIASVDLDDISQETILRALEAQERTEIREPKRFLIGIFKNVARGELARRAKYTEEVLDDLSLERHVSDEPSVEDAVDARARVRALCAVIATLPPQCQRVFVLKHVYGASHRDIAKKLGIALSTVEKHVALGLRRSREQMMRDLNIGTEADNGASILELPQVRAKSE